MDCNDILQANLLQFFVKLISYRTSMNYMKRHDIKLLKRSIANESNQEAMKILLERSVRMGHKNLALKRCIQAERMGINIPASILSYCQSIADQISPDVLKKILETSRQ